MARLKATNVFPNYTRTRRLVPAAIWWTLRVVVLAGCVALSTVLVLRPTLGLTLFWGIAVPLVPAFLVVAPGLWRQVCPFGLLNQIPHAMHFSQGKALPKRLADNAFAIAVTTFIGCVALRPFLLNVNGSAVAAMLAGAGGLAFLGGIVFEGRSGWCGTFCPLGPIQRNYGHAPVIRVTNTYCTTCVGCQKNCYDFNPEATLFDDIADEDPRYAGQRRFFVAMMPGVILGYFGQTGSNADYPVFLALYIGAMLVSVGLYQFLTSFLALDPVRTASAFGALALGLFYLFAGPTIVNAIEALTGVDLPPIVDRAAQAIGLLAAGLLAFNALKLARRYAAAQEVASPIEAIATPQTILVHDVGGAAPLTARSGETLLSVLEAARVPIKAHCRSGLCGSDAVLIHEGHAHLSPPSDEERATLRRLGLDGRARLACSCRVEGPVTFGLDLAQATEIPAAPPIPEPVIARQISRPDPDRVAVADLDQAGLAGISRIVIIGNGIAGITAAEELRRLSSTIAITILSAEPHLHYNRMAIARLMTGTETLDSLSTLPPDWAMQRGIDVKVRTRVASIDRQARVVTTLTGETVAYDRLILATGARAAVPVPTFLARDNAFVLRSAGDARAIAQRLATAKPQRALVIGGGVLGIEAAEALADCGLSVTILHRGPHLMHQTLDRDGAQALARYLIGRGIEIHLGAEIIEFAGATSLTSVRLADGRRIAGDLFIASIGTRANLDLAADCGLKTGKGISVDEQMRTSDPAIFAIGDAAEPRGGMPGLWPVAIAQAQVAAAAALHREARFELSVHPIHLKSDGIELYAAGDPNAAAREGDEVVTAPAFAPAWWRFVMRDGAIVSAVYVGPPGSANHLGALLKSGRSLTPYLADLRRGEIATLARRAA